ncbi:hypothetical protein JRI60_41075 [Archangium violaceum]|nr:hypothetical protein JRI60_41075 [Archangium violaceum]
MIVVELDVLAPGGSTREVAVTRAEFQRAMWQLAGRLRVEGTPREAAQWLFQAMPEEELLAEVYRDRVLSLVPLDDKGPLVPEAEAALRARYLSWCEGHGGGDCLGLFDDGPYLRTDDRRTLALALAFGTVLDETRQALGRELSPRAVLSSLVWAAGLYLALWLVPEPSTKAAAAGLSILLVAWLGVDTVWGLVDGWARMAHRAHEATTFAELREAGMEALARGRWVHARLKREFEHLMWNGRGVDVVDPAPGGQKYEVLSGTAENFAVHGRRMAGELYRMIFF